MVKKNTSFLNRKVSNRLAYTIIAAFAMIALTVLVYATPGAVPNPGHSLAQLQPCSNGETLVTASGVWTCATSGAGGQWTTSGSNVYNSNSGNIGVGTTTPGAKLDVNGDLRLGLISGDTNNDISSAAIRWLAGYKERANIKAVDYEWGNGKKALSFNLHTTSVDDFSNTEIMRITPVGVGIGTSTPFAALQVCTDGVNGKCSIGNVLALGNDLLVADIDSANTVGLRGAIDSATAGLQFGANGPTISGSGGSSGGSCGGTPQTCTTRTQPSCLTSQGCGYSPAFNCTTVPSQLECESGDFPGCNWDGIHHKCIGTGSGQCYGNANPCGTYSSSSTCSAAPGCSWTSTGSPAVLSVNTGLNVSGSLRTNGYPVGFVIANPNSVYSCQDNCAFVQATCLLGIVNGDPTWCDGSAGQPDKCLCYR